MMRARRLLLWAVACFALLAPMIANDRPLMASVSGEWRFPAFNTYLGVSEAAPGGGSWKAWSLELSDSTADWAMMPPWSCGPSEIQEGQDKWGLSLEHPLGTDDLGRDMFARIIHGATTAVMVASGSVLIAVLIGVLLGGLAGVLGGVADLAVARIIDVFACFPALITIMAGAAFFGGSTIMLICVLGSLYWTSFARIVRGEILSLREREFVRVARGLGLGHTRILVRHILPLIRGPICVCAAFMAGNAIVAESTLSYFGLGDGLATVSWGDMVRQGTVHAIGGAWHLWLVPALAIAVVVICLHGLGDELEDDLDQDESLAAPIE